MDFQLSCLLVIISCAIVYSQYLLVPIANANIDLHYEPLHANTTYISIDQIDQIHKGEEDYDAYQELEYEEEEEWPEDFINQYQTPAPTVVQSCSRCTCGTPNHKRIVGGVAVHYNKYPWLAQLTYAGNFYCGGTLINDRYILTAAHCVHGFKPQYISAKLLQFNRTTKVAVIRKVQKAIIHKSYTTSSLENDIALLKLDRPVTVKGLIKPACLPHPSNVFSNYMGVVAGWGTTRNNGPAAEILQEVKVPIISNEECRKTVYGKAITGKMLCAGYVKSGGKDACQGDSGGPLTVLSSNTHQIAGVVSFGNGCALKNSPGVYTRVTKFLRWILDNSSDACYCNPPVSP